MEHQTGPENTSFELTVVRANILHFVNETKIFERLNKLFAGLYIMDADDFSWHANV